MAVLVSRATCLAGLHFLGGQQMILGQVGEFMSACLCNPFLSVKRYAEHLLKAL